MFLTYSLITKVWSNGGASRALVFALVGSNPTSDNRQIDKIFALWANVLIFGQVLMAQWIERPTSNRKAAGSSPAKDYIALM